MGESGVHGGKVPCQSQRRTVPKEPSPNVLIGVYEREEPVREEKGHECEGGVHGDGTRTRGSITNYEFSVVYGYGGDADDVDGLLWLRGGLRWVMAIGNGVGVVSVVLRDVALSSMIRRHEHDTQSIAL